MNDQDREDIKELLEEAVKGEGIFDRDPLVHAGNVIENMQILIRGALKIINRQ